MKNKIMFWLMCALNVGCIFMITLLTEDVTHIATWITSTLSAIMAVGFAVLHAFGKDLGKIEDELRKKEEDKEKND